jgi:hypothetical protein
MDRVRELLRAVPVLYADERLPPAPLETSKGHADVYGAKIGALLIQAGG